MSDDLRQPLVLAIDGDQGIQRLLRLILTTAGYVVVAGDAAEGVGVAAARDPDLVLVDLSHGATPGVEVVARLKEAAPARPVIALTTRSDEAARVEALDRGADDVIIKPFDAEDLAERIQYLLNLAAGGVGESAALLLGDIEVDVRNRTVTRKGQPIVMSKTEWQLLKLLLAHNGEPTLFSEMLVKVWGLQYRDDVQFLKVWMARLRRKLGGGAGSRDVIRDFHGVGYGLNYSVVERAERASG